MPKAKIVTYGKNSKGKLVKTSKTVIKGVGADTNQAMAARGMQQSKTKGQLMSQQEQNRHTERMAEITNRAATTQAAIGQGAMVLRNTVNSLKPVQSGVTSSPTTTVGSVQNLVEGGAQSTSNSRDEEDEDEDGYANIA